MSGPPPPHHLHRGGALLTSTPQARVIPLVLQSLSKTGGLKDARCEWLWLVINIAQTTDLERETWRGLDGHIKG